jgi:hypothetical protein
VERASLRQQLREVGHQLAEVSRELAAMARDAVVSAVDRVTKTFAKPAPAKPVPALSAEQREAQRIARMSAAELRAEIAKTRPPPVDQVVSQRPEIVAAYNARLTLKSKADAARRRLLLAQQEIQDWRLQHPTKLAAHEKGIWKSAEYVDLEDKAALAEDASRKAEARRVSHDRAEGVLWAEVRAKVQEAQKPAHARVARLEAALEPKKAVERQEETARGRFERLASKVEAKSRDWEKHLEAAPPEVREKIREHNSLPNSDPYGPNSPRRQYRDKLSGPEFVKAMNSYQERAQAMGLDRSRGHGMER